MQRRHRRRHATLIELMISLGLAAVLLSTLFVYYFQANKIHQETKKAFAPLYLQYSLHQQFLRTLSKISFRDKINPEGGYCFSSPLNSSSDVKQSLVFTFDNGIDGDPLFSADVLARLYVDEGRRLILATWPSPLRWPEEESREYCRQEIVLEGIQSLSFSFYKPPFDDEGKEETNPNGWLNEWKKGIPSMIRITIEYHLDGESKKFEQTYPLEYADHCPTYYHKVNHGG